MIDYSTFTSDDFNGKIRECLLESVLAFIFSGTQKQSGGDFTALFGGSDGAFDKIQIFLEAT
jgi:hypothetical protein